MKHQKAYIFNVLFALVGLAVGLVFIRSLNDAPDQRDADARVEAAINLMQKSSQADDDPPAQYFIDVIRLENLDELSAEPINHVADMLGSDNWTNREYAAMALELLGPRANKGKRVVPALRQAIAEELALLKGRQGLVIGPRPTTYFAELRALGTITDTPYEQLLEHPEQFDKLPPDMDACLTTFNREECDRLLAEWKAAPY